MTNGAQNALLTGPLDQIVRNVGAVELWHHVETSEQYACGHHDWPALSPPEGDFGRNPLGTTVNRKEENLPSKNSLHEDSSPETSPAVQVWLSAAADGMPTGGRSVDRHVVSQGQKLALQSCGISALQPRRMRPTPRRMRRSPASPVQKSPRSCRSLSRLCVPEEAFHDENSAIENVRLCRVLENEAKVKIRSEERRGTSQQKMEVSINGLSSKVKVASLEIQVDFQNGESVQQRWAPDDEFT
ncbi:hypothetical protein B0H11DRAFT_2187923 [Mycena galericulata]|nr:hypothetical protein B0H11DRAFT_2187923 [Mycena galericulata]